MSVDRHREDPEYWEQILIRSGLGESRGLANQIIYVGGMSDFERLEENRLRGKEGQLEDGGRRVAPEGNGPDA